MSQLCSFIKNSKIQFFSTNPKQFHLSVGNKACDLDSMVSALSFAYYNSLVEPEKKCIGLIPIPIEEFRLRTEATYLFGEVGREQESLIDLDSFNSHMKTHSPTEFEIALVDHNLIEDILPSHYANHVIQIVDHHADLNGVYPNLKLKQIELVGSAATLVAEMFLQNPLTRNRQCLESDSSLRNVLLGTILLDTVGLNEKMGKTFEKDTKVVSELHALDTSVNLETFFQKIQFEKFNQSSLGTNELLIKDYKNFHASSLHYGMSSVLMSIQTWVAKGEDLFQKFQEFSEKKGLDILMCLNMYEDSNGFRRELIVYQPLLTKCNVPLLVQKLLEEKTLLDLVPLHQMIKGERVWCFSQSVVTSSRKQVEPLVRSLLEQLSKV